MPLWRPDNEWVGSDVFIIGGGPSLSGFNFMQLAGRNTIGCNAAFKIGVDLCKVCFFSDKSWFKRFESELQSFTNEGGLVVTHCDTLLPRSFAIKWLKIMRRQKHGLHYNQLGFNYNSGCGAVNLALVMGAKRVFLLGFDCRIPPAEKTHWHDWRIVAPNPRVYEQFMNGWRRVAIDAKRMFPRSKIINLGPDSAIECFPKANITEYLTHAEDNRRVG